MLDTNRLHGRTKVFLPGDVELVDWRRLPICIWRFAPCLCQKRRRWPSRTVPLVLSESI